MKWIYRTLQTSLLFTTCCRGSLGFQDAAVLLILQAEVHCWWPEIYPFPIPIRVLLEPYTHFHHTRAVSGGGMLEGWMRGALGRARASIRMMDGPWVMDMLVGSRPKKCPPLVSRTQNGQHEAHQRSVPGLSPAPRQVDELGLPTEPPTARAVFPPFPGFTMHPC